MATVNPFLNIPILKDWVLDVKARIYAYFKTNPAHDITKDMRINIFNDLQTLNATVHDIGTLLKDELNKVGNVSFVILNELLQHLQESVAVLINELTRILSSYIHNNRVPSISTAFSKFLKKLSHFEKIRTPIMDTLEHLKDQSVQALVRFLDIQMQRLRHDAKVIMDKLTSQVIAAVKGFTGLGLKFRATLKLFGLKFPDVDLELVYSNRQLLSCSRFQNLANLFKGEEAVRGLMTVSTETRLGFFLRLKAGVGFGIAFSTSSSKWLFHARMFATMLGIRASADVYIGSNGLTFRLEGNIWNAFLARLDVRAELSKDWYGIEYTIHGRLGGRGRGDNSFESSYLDALINCIGHMADGAKKRLSQAQDGVSNAQHALSKAKNGLEKAKVKIRSANHDFDRAIQKLEGAKRTLEKAKGPFRKAIEKLNKAQRKIDNLCRIRHCGRLCIPGLKCRICWKKAWFFKIPYPCCHWTRCMISFPNPLCLAANLVCRGVRALAYAGLEVAKAFVRIPMAALDAAKIVVSGAQFVVDKSRVVLKIAEGALDVAQLGLEGTKFILEGAKLALEGLKFAIGAAAKVLEFVVKIGLKSIIDVRNCQFTIKIQNIALEVFGISCEVNPFRLGWTKIGFRINFRNILQSIWQAAKATIDTVIKTFGHIFSGRRRRDISYQASRKMHFVIRNIRQSGDIFSDGDELLNRTIDVTNSTLGLSANDTFDYDQRCAIYNHKCKEFTKHMNFMTDTVGMLFEIANESKSTMDMFSELHQEIRQHSIDDPSDIDLNKANVSIDYAKHYNLTKSDLEKAMTNIHKAIEDDPNMNEIKKTTDFAKSSAESQRKSIDFNQFTSSWMLGMENITKEHFNKTECVDFRDCVLHTVTTMYDIFAAEENINQTEIAIILTDLEDGIFSIAKNHSFNIEGIYQKTKEIKTTLDKLSDINIFCSTPPSFDLPLQNATTVEGRVAIFQCFASGDPEPNYWWYKNDDLLNERSNILMIRDVSLDDMARYRCMAGNVVANITSNEAIILIRERESEYKKVVVEVSFLICKNNQHFFKSSF